MDVQQLSMMPKFVYVNHNRRTPINDISLYEEFDKIIY